MEKLIRSQTGGIFYIVGPIIQQPTLIVLTGVATTTSTEPRVTRVHVTAHICAVLQEAVSLEAFVASFAIIIMMDSFPVTLYSHGVISHHPSRTQVNF